MMHERATKRAYFRNRQMAAHFIGMVLGLPDVYSYNLCPHKTGWMVLVYMEYPK